MRLPPNIAWSFEALARIARSRRAPRLCAFSRHEAGSVVVLAAILFPILVGGMGLGAETGYWYLSQRKLQHTADASAYAGAVRKRAGDDGAHIKAAADHIAAASGVPSITVDSEYAPNSVEVVISKTQPLFFSSIFRSEPVTIHARAVAQHTSHSIACVLALSKTAAGAVTVSGSASVNLTGCDVHSNSNASNSLVMSGSGGTLTTDCVSTVGNISINPANLTVSNPSCPKVEIAEIPDPYKKVQEPVVAGTCRSSKVGNPNGTIPEAYFQELQQLHPSGVQAVRFCTGLDLKGTVRFAPGLYIIEGDVTVTAGDSTQLFGEGVTFFITSGGRLRFNGAAQLNLSAPNEGPFKGILFFGSRDDNVSHRVNGSAGSTLTGAIYAAGADIDYTGNSTASNGCTQLIGNTITFSGNSTMTAECEATGTSQIENQTVSLVE